jgi:sortase A
MERAARRRPRRRVTVWQVIGELMLTVAFVVGLYVVWQIWINDAISDADQGATADRYAQEWSHGTVATPAPEDAPPARPVVTRQPRPRQVFATLIVPRFGADFRRPIAEGTGYDVLSNSALGMGHYPSTALPGEIGNFAIASHRTAYGGALHIMQRLRVGDHVFIETRDGWYQYSFRNIEYVQVSGVGVLDDVPQNPDTKATQRILTMTTCNPLYSSAERMIGYGLFDRFYPRAGGPPAEIATTVSEEDS